MYYTSGEFEHERNERSQLGLRHFLDGRRDAINDQRRQFIQRRVVLGWWRRVMSQRRLQILFIPKIGFKKLQNLFFP